MSKETIAPAPVSPSAGRPRSSARFADWAPYLAEGIGTFALVFAGCGAIVIDTLSGG